MDTKAMKFRQFVESQQPMIVNNTGKDLSMFNKVIMDCIVNNKPLPEEISDIFTLKIINVNGQLRGVIDWV
jgi:hypothetical protein